MAEVHGTLGKPVEEAEDVLRRVGLEQRWHHAAEESRPGLLVLTKGLNFLSFSSRLEARLTPEGEGQTRIEIRTSESFGMADWGRGKRSAVQLLEGSGATII
jgi:hypothetical protein